MKKTKTAATTIMSMCTDFLMGGINEETFKFNLSMFSKNLGGGFYDSEVDTLKHIKRVNQSLIEAASELIRRANCHDDSKLKDPEKPVFDEHTPLLKASTYGYEGYNKFFTLLKPALDHHYKHNSHHPEHYSNGVNGFDLFDLTEMFFDWKAATERHNDGNIFKSIEINKERFGLSDQVCDIFRNTANKLGY